MQRISLLLAGFAPAVLWGQQGAGTELWRVAGTALGATLAYQDTRLDVQGSNRWTLDLGARHTFPGAVTLAAATRCFSRFAAGDPAQDLYGGVELRLWHGPLWGSRAAVSARYGVATAHGFTADHQFGAGFELGTQFASDLEVQRDGSYGQAGWRAVAGVRVEGGRYRVSFARDFGVNDIGAAYRVGLEGRIP